MSANTVLAYLFGFTFSGVLAYAGLRDKPITDPGQFFLLRLIAALSAAGIAAVLPGFFDFKWTASKNVVVRGGGALGVFALAFLANPPQLIQSHVKEREISMLGDYDSGRYLDAERLADEILKEDSKNARAWNVKGGVSYYRQDYQQAKDCFEKALSLSPNNPYYSSNLGYAQVE